MSDIKKIKRNLYGKPQTILAVFPAGMGETALAEIQGILGHQWFPQKYLSEFSIQKNIIRIEPIHLFTVTELLMRSQSLSDIRLVIFEGHASGKEAFRKKCMSINWSFFLDKNITLKIKVNSIASRAFHETALKEILGDILKDHIDHIVTGENTDETTSLYVDLFHDKLTVSLSLAGAPLYKRGFREVLSVSAPLREDAAFCCIQRALQFSQYLPEMIFIPFSGTGTFALEYLQLLYRFSPVLFSRDYALKHFPFFNRENFNFLLKRAKEYFLPFNRDLDFICVDRSESAVSSFLQNINNFKAAFLSNDFLFPENKIECLEGDFFKMSMDHLKNKSVFMPLNPPYGVRLEKDSRSDELYKKIAVRISEISVIAKKLSGFVLCPDEKSWSVFCNTIKNFKTETYHFNQGGLDIRVCQFVN